MFDEDNLLELLSDGIKTISESETYLRGVVLGCDMQVYEICCEGTEWDDKYGIKSVLIDSHKYNIRLNVDLSFFTYYGESGGNVSLSMVEIDVNTLIDMGIIKECEAEYIAFEIEYYVVSCDTLTAGSQYRYICLPDKGNEDSQVTYFDITIHGGRHIFQICWDLLYLGSSYFINLSVLKHFRDCEIDTSGLFLIYDDKFSLADYNIIFINKMKYIIGIIGFTDKSLVQMLNIFKYKENNINTDIGVKLMVIDDNPNIGVISTKFEEWICKCIDELERLQISCKIMLEYAIYYPSDARTYDLYTVNDKPIRFWKYTFANKSSKVLDKYFDRYGW